MIKIGANIIITIIKLRHDPIKTPILSTFGRRYDLIVMVIPAQGGIRDIQNTGDCCKADLLVP
jgi:hypothetical protein